MRSLRSISNAKGLTVQADDRERLTRAGSLEMQRIVQNHQAYLLGKQEARLGGWEPSEISDAASAMPSQQTGERTGSRP